MTNVDWIQLFRRIPEAEQGKLIIVLNTGTELYVDALCRMEEGLVVIRGRLAGSQDEGRGFFIPYDNILCLKLDRILKVEELNDLFPADTTAPARKSGVVETPIIPPSERPTPTVPTDPAAASKLLLERIRAVRASSAKFPSHSG